MQVLKDEHKEALENGQIKKPIPWFANDELVEHETLFLYRKEAGQNSLLDKFTIDLGMMPTFEDFQFAVKELHGGGIYEATARSVSGAYTKRLNFSLAGFPKKPKEDQQQNTAQAESSTDKLLTFLVQSQQRSEERMLQVLDKLAEKPAAPEIDPFLIVERVAGLLGKTGAAPPAPKTMLEQMIELKQVKDILSEDLPITGGTDGWGAVTAALGPLSEVLKENTINERLKLQIALKQSQNKAPAPVQAAQVTAQPVQTIAAPKFAALIAKFKPVLAGLIPYVEQGQPPSLIASALLASVPDTDKPELLEFLSRDDALNDMARLEPKVANHWDWFTELANELIELIQATPNDTGTTAAPTAPTTTEPKVEAIGGSAGDTANATDHGKVNPPRTRKPRSKGASVTTGQAT